MIEQSTGFARIAQEIREVLLPEPITSIEVPDGIPVPENRPRLQTDNRLSEMVQRVGGVLFPSPLTLQPVGIAIGENMQGTGRSDDNSMGGSLERTATLLAKKKGKRGVRRGLIYDHTEQIEAKGVKVEVEIYGVPGKKGQIDIAPKKGRGRHSLGNDRAAQIEKALIEKNKPANIRKRHWLVRLLIKGED